MIPRLWFLIVVWFIQSQGFHICAPYEPSCSLYIMAMDRKIMQRMHRPSHEMIKPILDDMETLKEYLKKILKEIQEKRDQTEISALDILVNVKKLKSVLHNYKFTVLNMKFGWRSIQLKQLRLWLEEMEVIWKKFRTVLNKGIGVKCNQTENSYLNRSVS